MPYFFSFYMQTAGLFFPPSWKREGKGVPWFLLPERINLYAKGISVSKLDTLVDIIKADAFAPGHILLLYVPPSAGPALPSVIPQPLSETSMHRSSCSSICFVTEILIMPPCSLSSRPCSMAFFHHRAEEAGEEYIFFRIHILPYFRYAVKFIREPELLDIQINIDMLQLSA